MDARLRFSALLAVTLAVTAMPRTTGAEEAASQSPFGDLQVRSAPESTEITLELRSKVPQEDRAQRRPGLSATGAAARVTAPARELAPAAAQTPEAEAPPIPEASPAEGEAR